MGLNILFLLLVFLVNCNPPASQNIDYQKESYSEKSNSEDNFTARVIRIVDGDTLEVMYGELPVMIRLAHIDCPEKRGSQPFGNAAKKALSDLCFGQNIEIEFTGDKDRNGRYICVIYNQNGLNLNKEMIRLGMAWHYKKYSTDQEYDRLEQEARQSKIGLWADPDPTPPWQWRK